MQNLRLLLLIAGVCDRVGVDELGFELIVDDNDNDTFVMMKTGLLDPRILLWLLSLWVALK